MTCSAILSQFEVRLHDDVLRDLLLPDKVFKHDLSDIHCVGQYGAASTATGTAPSVQLEKISDSVIRLLITGKFHGLLSLSALA